MRIAIITQGLSPIVRPLVASGHDVIAIAESAPRESGEITHRRLRRGISSVLSLLRPGRLNLEQYARKNATPYFWLEKTSMASFGAWLSDASPDVLVVFSMSQLLPPSVFTIPRLGTINLHPSFLPEYRGPNPDFWQYYDFSAYGGVTVHHIDEGEDTGDIICQARVPIVSGTRSPEWNTRVVEETGTRLLLKAVDDMAAGRATREPQPRRSTTARARLVNMEEHDKIIDWDVWPIERIWHVMRGTETWLRCIPRPTGIWTGQLWTIGSYVRGSSEGNVGTVQRDEQGYFIACRDGLIRLSVRFSLRRALRRLLLKE